MKDQTMKDQKEYFAELSEVLDRDLEEMTEENRFAFYGYLFGFHEMGHISTDHYGQLTQRLDLEVEELDRLRL